MASSKCSLAHPLSTPRTTRAHMGSWSSSELTLAHQGSVKRKLPLFIGHDPEPRAHSPAPIARIAHVVHGCAWLVAPMPLVGKPLPVAARLAG